MAALALIGAPVLIALTSASVKDRPVLAGAADTASQSPDLACARCHGGIVASYARTPMARASGPARDSSLVGSFVHKQSGIRYDVEKHDEESTLRFERVLPGTGQPLKGEIELRYFIGSNTRGRTYLFEMDNLWFETPINWYSKRALWDMAPAYENARSMPFTTPVDADCLHCHATGIAAPTGVSGTAGARNHFAGQPFTQGGIGCSACHGDSSAHLASGGRKPTINPATLSPLRRDSVCLQCHLEGDAVVHRAGRSLSSFLPGDDLSTDAVYFVDQASKKSQGRASSQYEALLRSACKRANGDRLTCTTCHDPHSTPVPSERVAFFRAKCLQCHTGESMATRHHPEQQSCAACHMPTRSTTDISHEQLTDHDIERRPSTEEQTPKLALVSPLAPAAAQLHAAELVPVGGWEAGPRDRGLAYAQFATRGDRVAAARALSLLRRAEFDGKADSVVHANLGYLLQSQGQIAAAEAEYLQALAADAHDITATTNLAILEAGAGRAEEAKRRLSEVLVADPAQTPAVLDLALLQCQTGEREAARATVERALVFDPDNADAHRFLNQGRYGSATCSLR